MAREQLLSRIWIDPKRCFGKPRIRGHRILMSLILDLHEHADILACIAYGSEVARER